MAHKLLGAAAVAALAYAFVPAHAVTVGVGCSGQDQAKAQSTVDAMADGPAKFMAEREIAQAQDAFLSNRMGACAMHLDRAMNAGTLAAAPYPGMMAPGPYAGARAEVPYAGRRVPYPNTRARAPVEPEYQVPPPSRQDRME